MSNSAQVSTVTLPDGNTYALAHGILDTKTYTGFYSTAETDAGRQAYFLKIMRADYDVPWRVRFRLTATVPNHPDYAYMDWDVDYFGFQDSTKSKYIKTNPGTECALKYLYGLFPTDNTNDICYIGFSAYSANETNSDYARSVKVDLLEYENCTAELLSDLIRRSGSDIDWTDYINLSIMDDIHTPGYHSLPRANGVSF